MFSDSGTDACTWVIRQCPSRAPRNRRRRGTATTPAPVCASERLGIRDRFSIEPEIVGKFETRHRNTVLPCRGDFTRTRAHGRPTWQYSRDDRDRGAREARTVAAMWRAVTDRLPTLAACSSGKSSTTPTTIAPTTVPATTTPVGTALKGDAFCIAAAGAVHSENSVNLANGTVASVKAAAAQAIAGVLAAGKAAPPDIKAEWAKLIADLQEFKQALAASGYDITAFKASKAGSEELNNPDWARTFQAIDRISRGKVRCHTVTARHARVGIAPILLLALTLVVAGCSSSSKTSAPGAPTDVKATPSGANAKVSFAAPDNDGGSPITNYTAACSSPEIATKGAQAKASPITVPGLSGGHTYACVVERDQRERDEWHVGPVGVVRGHGGTRFTGHGGRGPIRQRGRESHLERTQGRRRIADHRLRRHAVPRVAGPAVDHVQHDRDDAAHLGPAERQGLHVRGQGPEHGGNECRADEGGRHHDRSTRTARERESREGGRRFRHGELHRAVEQSARRSRATPRRAPRRRAARRPRGPARAR